MHLTARPIAVDLFSGAGGLSEGLRKAGFRVACAIELDPFAIEAYRLNHPRVKVIEGDIRKVSGAAILRAASRRKGQIDLLAACPPCQGFSTLRTRNGRFRNRDPRNRLLGDVLRLTKTLLPKAVMLENVPGLALSAQFTAFRRTLASMGYKIRWDILNVCNYGVPQRRRRLVLLASRTMTPEFAPKARVARTVRWALASLPAPKKSRDPLHNYRPTRSDKVLRRIRQIPANGGSRSALKKSDRLHCHDGSAGFRDVYGRMAWDRPSPTITGGCINPSKGRFLHPSQDRAITLREAAVLQSFPRSYRFPLTRGRYPAALLIGNALPPEFVRRHAVSLRPTAS
jgi:DNA (cytosine-5)-methyltransferase 1